MLRRGVVTAIVSSVVAAACAIMIALGVETVAAADTHADGGWIWPTGTPSRVLNVFVGPPQPWLPGHRGVDIAADSGELRAPSDAVVRFVGHVVDRGVLSLDHGGGIVSSYEPVTAIVAEGDRVAAGELIALVAAGHCAVRCVHMGVRVDGEYRNPLRWLGGAQWPVLLPTRHDRRRSAEGGRAALDAQARGCAR